MAAIGDAVITVEAEPKVLSMLRDIADEQTLIREYLARLVAIEEERRDGERKFEGQMDEISAAIKLGGADPERVEELDWYRDVAGNFRERNTNRPLTQQEIDAVTYSPRREARERR